MKAVTARAVVLVALAVLAAGCDGRQVTKSGVRYVDLVKGSGPPAKFNDIVHFTYVATFADGQVFEKREPGNPAATRIGFGAPVPGVDEGMEGMQAGGKRKLWVPSRLAYGVAGIPARLPPNTDMIYEVELVRIVPLDEVREMASKKEKEDEAARKQRQTEREEVQKKLAALKDLPQSEWKDVTTPSGLVYKDVRIGIGKVVAPGNHVFVRYVGKLTNGAIFDAKTERDRPFDFVLGQGRVIKGWEEGLVGMQTGGKRILLIPPELGYGKSEAAGGKIPANSSLIFELELVNVY
jgi:FKBP-type peptidyl-prolyl cis-trans isomerase